MNRSSAIWLVLGSIASIQFGAAVGKSLFDDAPALGIAWLRIAFAAVILWAIARPRLRGHSRSAWLTLGAWTAVLGLMNVAIYLSFARIPIGMAVTIEFLGPLAVALAGSRRWRDVLWVVLAGMGVALLGLNETTRDWWGIALAALAAACWAGYIILGQRLGTTSFRSVDSLALGCAGVGIALAPITLASVDTSGLWDVRVLALCAVVGVLSSVIPYTLELTALRRMPRALFSILMSIEPAAAALMAWLVIGEVLTMRQLVAVTLVVAASVGATWSASRARAHA